mmetsp:Transcript_25196/g.56516  ORF Transcript_25196/g.56516 Transcript_25196/m.56516 type:complete len:769 (-) Transcript_25196:515-2821(-)
MMVYGRAVLRSGIARKLLVPRRSVIATSNGFFDQEALASRRRLSPPSSRSAAVHSYSAPCSNLPAVRHLSTAAVEETDDDCAYTLKRREGIRNVAIVAHVDHGKTTLVDELLKVATSSTDIEGNETADDADLNRLMDSGELEKERGITITSKVTRLDYTSESNESYTINVVDTPGHADFAGEVDRILSTVDGVVLVVDAGEGPKSQTKYVLTRALSLGLVPIVVLNKADREESILRLEGGETELELMDLFEALGADADQMEYRTLYGSARGGWIADDVDVALKVVRENGGSESEGAMSMRGLLEAILEDIPSPSVHWYDESSDDSAKREASEFENEPFSMAATTVGFDSYLGRTCTGRIYSGVIQSGDSITLLPRLDSDSAVSEGTGPKSQVSGVFANRGVSRVALDPPIAHAGDIVTLAGVPDSVKVGDTLTSTNNQVPSFVDTPPLAPPTLSCLFGANNGPLGGREGDKVSSSHVRSRLMNETDNNVTLNVEKCESDAEKTVVLGRGELQIGILVEQMRREGYELVISPPQVLTQLCPITGEKIEPWEEVVVDVDAEYSGAVVNALTGARKGVLVEMMDDSQGKTRLKFEVPTRGLLGFGPEIATSTRGTAVMHHCFIEDRPYAGLIQIGADKGRLVSNDTGKATSYALESLQNRGTLFVGPGEEVYPGMVIGENSKAGDMEVNPVRAKKADNMRTQAKEEKMYLTPPKRRSVEELIGYMCDDEVIEVTPNSVRLRKLELDSKKREVAARNRKKQLDSLKNAKRRK